MDKKTWSEIREIFAHLSEESPSFRRDYLNMTLDNKPDIREQVELMLAAHDDLESEPDKAQSVAPVVLPDSVGDYKILQPIASGGMSSVFKASHPEFGLVAIKCLPQHLFSNTVLQERFVREATVLSSVQHPVICTLFETLQIDDASALVMEFIDGDTLDQHLNYNRFELTRAVDIARQLASALVCAHEQGVVHRDIKPSNIMLNQSGEVKLIDFGIAYLSDTDLTVAGEMLGSPSYMSPEQWCGKRADEKADIWSLGVLIHHMVCGESPFAGQNFDDVSRNVLIGSASEWRQSKDDVQYNRLGKLVKSMLEKDKKDRPESMQQVLDILSTL